MELLQKLKIKPGQPVWLVNAPPGCQHLFDGNNIIEKLGRQKPADHLVLFVTTVGELNHFLPLVTEFVSPDTLFWIFYPKKSGAITSDLAHMKNWDIVSQSGYRGQTSVSVNSDWSGFRITSAPKEKPGICDLPMEERKVEGIDFVNRTVTLPDDALSAVSKYPGMVAFFNTLSFTAKKEYVIAITDAKKPETRQKRIEKMIAEMQQKMHVKSK